MLNFVFDFISNFAVKEKIHVTVKLRATFKHIPIIYVHNRYIHVSVGQNIVSLETSVKF